MSRNKSLPPGESLIPPITSAIEPIDLAKLFPAEQPPELELGCGDGSFTLRYALAHPEALDGLWAAAEQLLDRTGHRVDEVTFHPSWHALMRTSVGHGLAAAPWAEEPGTGAHVTRAAGFYLTSQVEQGHLCPISMTYASVPALRHAPELAAAYAAAHERYLAARAEIAAEHGLDVPEIEGISAGGMPDRVKCLHVLAGQSLAMGRGVNPLGDEVLDELGEWWRSGPCVDSPCV